ncbi:MAG TPA: hypothetical protein VHV08_02745 [Pirellulales bacterium]|nr:hypothetical protein [Pirellulales bacterium]
MAKMFAPDKAYVNALSFRAAVVALNSCTVSVGVDRLLLFWPTVVCEAFSLELFLKCLHAIRGIPHKQKHDVETLFGVLSTTDKDTTTKYFHEIVQLHPQHSLALMHGVSFDIEAVLQRTKDAFIKVRYWHEGTPPSADASGKISNAGVGSLCDALNRFIDEIRPEWRTMSLHTSVLMENQPPPT